ncbi:MAG: hypothetical protein ACREA0_26850 [bacterium]
MRNRFLISILAMASSLAILPVLLAQTPQPPGAANRTPDLSGVWGLARERGGPGNGRLSLEDPPLQSWARELYGRNRRGVDEDNDPASNGRDEFDPNSYCFPPGPTRAIVSYPFEIYHAANKVVMLFEVSNGVRRIWMDGREHPEGWPFGWMGHSVGRWDGDTLVVDTAGLNDKTWIDRGGSPHSDALHIVERIRRVRQDALEVDFLLEDPKTFTKPWMTKRAYALLPDDYEMLDIIACEDVFQIGGEYRKGQFDTLE